MENFQENPTFSFCRFPDLFSDLEADIGLEDGGLGVDSYGVSMTTLEEIFLKLGEEEEEEDGGEEHKKRRKKDDNNRTEEDAGLSNAGAALEESESSFSESSSGGEGRKEDKDDLGGYSFEAVPTSKSDWQMYKALVYVRAIRKVREPGMIIVQASPFQNIKIVHFIMSVSLFLPPDDPSRPVRGDRPLADRPD